MGKKKKPQVSQTVIVDPPVTVEPGDPGVEQTDAHLEGHGKDG
jgi:hypothetical protein